MRFKGWKHPLRSGSLGGPRGDAGLESQRVKVYEVCNSDNDGKGTPVWTFGAMPDKLRMVIGG